MEKQLLTEFEKFKSRHYYIPKIVTEFNSNILFIRNNRDSLTYILYSNVRDKLMYQFLKYSDLILQLMRKFSNRYDTQQKITEILQSISITVQIYENLLTEELNSMSDKEKEEFKQFLSGPTSYIFQLKKKVNHPNKFKSKNASYLIALYDKILSSNMIPETIKFGETDTDIFHLNQIYFSSIKLETYEYFRNAYPLHHILIFNKYPGVDNVARIQYDIHNIASLNYLNLYYNVNKYISSNDELQDTIMFYEKLSQLEQEIESTRESGIIDNFSPLKISDAHDRKLFEGNISGYILKKPVAPNNEKFKCIILFYTDDDFCELVQDTETGIIEFSDVSELSNSEFVKNILTIEKMIF